MRGVLAAAVRSYRRRGVLPTIDDGLSQLAASVRRLWSVARWRATGVASVRAVDETFHLHAATSHERHSIWYLEEYEADQVDRLVARLEADDVFYDIGANVGYYTCAAATASDAEVHAFEPHPGNADRIAENLELNDASGEVHELALADTDGEIEFALDSPDTPGFSHGVVELERTPSEAEEAITVDQRTTETVVENGTPAPTVVKIDVEGAEGMVLDGMRRFLESGQVRVLFLEVHNPAEHRPSVEDFGSSEDEILEQLGDLEYSVESYDWGGDECRIIATR